MAIDALQTLSKNHIWVLKTIWKKDKLHDKVKNEPEWALKTVIKSFDNACDIKHIKAELVPSVLSAGEWTAWHNKIKDILEQNPIFGVSPQDINIYLVRDRPISFAEKLYNEFKAETKFFNRVEIITKFTAREDFELDSEYFTEMFAYFTAYIKPYTQTGDQTKTGAINEQIIASYLLVKNLAGQYPALAAGLQFNFIALFEQIDNIIDIFIKIKSSELRRDFLKQIKLFSPGWANIYIRLFPHTQLDVILHSLLEAGFEDKLVTMTANCFDSYRDRESRDTAVWLYKNYRETDWFKRTGLSEEKVLITFIYILDITYREIDNHHDTPENRRTNKLVFSLLFTEKLLDNYLAAAFAADDRNTINRMCTLLDDVRELDPAIKMELHRSITDKYPDFKFAGGDIKELVTRGLIVTQAKYEEKQRQLARILDEEVPANSKEIAFALSLGDLRENAEYKAAKEKQEILNSTVAKLKDEIERSQLFDPRQINTNRVSFGTIVKLENEAGQIERYTILGPWESDPDHQVISYLSPFGSTMMSKKAGEQFTFQLGDEKVSYLVKDIIAVEL
jgi:transcription elongation factor GreA